MINRKRIGEILLQVIKLCLIYTHIIPTYICKNNMYYFRIKYIQM